MARLLRVQFAGAIYYVTVRGNERRPIFNDDKDRERILEQRFGGEPATGQMASECIGKRALPVNRYGIGAEACDH